MEWLSKINVGPEELFALAVGTLVSLAVTQVVKKKWQLGSYRWLIRAIAFLIGGFATYTTYPPVGLEFGWPQLWAGVIVGAWTPTAFKVFKVIAKKKGWEWAESI